MSKSGMILPSGPRGNQSRQTFESIRELIVGGALEPGARIIETDLAERLGVTRGTLRPALQRLHQEGLVVGQVPGRQTRLVVAPVTKSDGRELYYLAGDLEGLAAAWAAELADVPRLEMVKAMDETNEMLRSLRTSGRLRGERLLELDRRFHECYIAIGGGPRTRSLLLSLRPQLERYARLYTRSLQERVSVTLDEHDEIIAALRSGDAVRSRAAVEANWRRGAERLIEMIDIRGEMGGSSEVGEGV